MKSRKIHRDNQACGPYPDNDYIRNSTCIQVSQSRAQQYA
jgi:hypothetical protein